MAVSDTRVQANTIKTSGYYKVLLSQQANRCPGIEHEKRQNDICWRHWYYRECSAHFFSICIANFECVLSWYRGVFRTLSKVSLMMFFSKNNQRLIVDIYDLNRFFLKNFLRDSFLGKTHQYMILSAHFARF